MINKEEKYSCFAQKYSWTPWLVVAYYTHIFSMTKDTKIFIFTSGGHEHIFVIFTQIYVGNALKWRPIIFGGVNW